MKKFYILALILFIGISKNNAQTVNQEEDAVKQTINNLFDGMRNSDSTFLRKAFTPKSIMQTIATRDGKAMVRTESVDGFIKSVSAPHPEKYDERIVFTKVLIDGNLASVWTDYKFYVGDKFSHCGVNSFQLFKGDDGWKIIYLIDTRRKDNCN
ncbi:nuclear transport factor 2 family protein [Pedobacter insulae]|uniref:Putative lumazine-binding n=1 Tax=Pedobacter insulae TaxID=414048 RepID=A0A1I2SZ76_9SPHI|nr:nuclear transport factor 2 family protein [Pedobacter insulae]SFG57239.1 Putative lumazine-binding [Pedobacter insulae]